MAGCFEQGGVTTKWRKNDKKQWMKHGFYISDCCDMCISFNLCLDKFKQNNPVDAKEIELPEEEA
jgi:hypothetical protein